MSEKIVKESEVLKVENSGWTLDEILRLEVRTNRYSPFRGSSSFIKGANESLAQRRSINHPIRTPSVFHVGSILTQLFTPTPATPTKRQVMCPLNKLNFDRISPTPPTRWREIFKNERYRNKHLFF
ncbi:hypothetical protein TNCV_4690351 [Trichonephila clavipes]|nr:hypothetical protein TNCV_4690351 [Trichonephila clavipes]